MQMTSIEPTSIITVVSVGALALWLRNWLPSYLKRKGENAATKEDIQGITQKIESVKLDYSSKLEALRSEFGVVSAQRNLLNERGFESLTRFFDTALSLIKEKLEVRPGDIGSIATASDELYKYQLEVEHLFTKLAVDYHKLVLFHIDKPGILEAANNVVIAAGLVHQSFRQHFGDVKSKISEEAWAVSADNKARIASVRKASDEAVRAYYDDFRPLKKNLDGAFSEYLKALHNHIKQSNQQVEIGALKSFGGEQ